MMKALWLLLLLFATVIIWLLMHGWPPEPAEGSNARIEISLSRVFGSCSDEYGGVTDLSKAVGECGVIQVLINKFNAENALAAHVITQSTQSAGYYDRLSAAFAARHPPDIALMHQNMLPDFVERGLLVPVRSALAALSVSWEDFVPAAIEGVSFGEEAFGLPFDLHALLWHLNLGLLREAGLTEPDGSPRLPSSPQELKAHAEQFKARTGKRYFAIPSVMDPMPAWTFETWIWQQRSDIISHDRRTTNVLSPPAQTALHLLNSLYQEGHASRSQDYTGAEQAFLSGEAGVLINGTWVVDSYREQSKRPESGLKHYSARTAPTIFEADAAWGDSHVWVMPRPDSLEPRKRDVALAFLKFLYDHSGEWARTGHLPVRKSVLESPAFLSLPGRKEYVGTAAIARSFQQVENQRAIQYFLVQEINGTWLEPRPPEESLRQAGREIQEILDRTHRRNLKKHESGASRVPAS